MQLGPQVLSDARTTDRSIIILGPQSVVQTRPSAGRGPARDSGLRGSGRETGTATEAANSFVIKSEAAGCQAGGFWLLEVSDS
eukprot:762514-Hanusia_phi.AAC.5